MSRGSADARSPGPSVKCPPLCTVRSDFPRRGGAFRETTSKDRFRRALLLMKPAHTGHHPGAVPGFRPSPGNSEETTTRVLTEEISVLFRVPTWDPTHPGSPSGSTWEHTHPGAYSGRETRVFPGGRWEPRSQPRSWPRKNPGTGWIPGFFRVVLLGVAGFATWPIPGFPRVVLLGVALWPCVEGLRDGL